MKTSWVMMVFFLFISLQFLCSITTGGGLMTANNDISVSNIQELFSPKGFDISNPVVGIYSIVTAFWHYIVGFFNMLFWNYPIFEGNWVFVKWLVCYPLTAGIIMSFVVIAKGGSNN